MDKLAVIALGGNALLREGQDGTIEEQEENARQTMENLVPMIKEGYKIIITHGNGPQIGNILLRNLAGKERYNVAEMPLDICVADSQGGIGYMLERILRNVLTRHSIHRDILTLVTQVIVSENDPAMKNPVKPIGKVYTKADADQIAKNTGWIFKPTPKKQGGWRRVVPSPKPIQIFNRETIEKNARNGVIVIAAGGGGIPVYLDAHKMIRTLDAVIDKDAAAALLASRIHANEFYILTDVPYVYINYNKPHQKKCEFLNLRDTEQYLKDGHFAEGSMEPKIRAALQFIYHGGEKSVITEANKLSDKRFGTKITLNY